MTVALKLEPTLADILQKIEELSNKVEKSDDRFADFRQATIGGCATRFYFNCQCYHYRNYHFCFKVIINNKTEH